MVSRINQKSSEETMEQQSQDLIGAKGAARILDLSEDSVRRLHREGRLPGFVTDSGHRVFDKTVVERLATERKERRSGSK
jgi:predicted site-specific integrase-resolvase